MKMTYEDLQSRDEAMYFIAIVLPPPIYEEAMTQKEYFKLKYNSKASLNSPPHITLHMPFKKKVKNETLWIERLNEFFKSRHPFPLSLVDYSSFPPRVIFITVAPNAALTNLQYDLNRFCKMSLNLFNSNYRDLPFHPHVTIAFRDLKKTKFEAAWAEFKEKKFQAEFVVDSVFLLKHNGNLWVTHHQFNLDQTDHP